MQNRLIILQDDKIRLSVKNRIAKKITKLANGCWGYDGAHNEHGYPTIGIGGKSGFTTRLSRIMLYLEAPIDENLYCLHKCDNPKCINPEHLYWGTAKQNTQDAILRSRFKYPPILTRDKTSRCYIKTHEDIYWLSELCEKYTTRQIALLLNKKYNTTAVLLKRLGLKARKSKPSERICTKKRMSYFENPERELKLKSMINDKKMSVINIAKHYSVGRNTIYTQLQRLGLLTEKQEKNAKNNIY